MNNMMEDGAATEIEPHDIFGVALHSVVGIAMVTSFHTF